jgi:regulatory protein
MSPRSDDPAAEAREICLNQLAARARSRAELRATLDRRGVEPSVAEGVLDRLTEVGLIDDRAFAAALVASAQGRRSMGRSALAHELRRRGVDDEVSGDVLEVVGADDEEASARALVARRLPAMGDLPVQVRVRRLTGQLARRGYSHELVTKVISDAIDGHLDSE